MILFYVKNIGIELNFKIVFFVNVDNSYGFGTAEASDIGKCLIIIYISAFSCVLQGLVLFLALYWVNFSPVFSNL